MCFPYTQDQVYTANDETLFRICLGDFILRTLVTLIMIFLVLVNVRWGKTTVVHYRYNYYANISSDSRLILTTHFVHSTEKLPILLRININKTYYINI